MQKCIYMALQSSDSKGSGTKYRYGQYTDRKIAGGTKKLNLLCSQAFSVSVFCPFFVYFDQFNPNFPFLQNVWRSFVSRSILISIKKIAIFNVNISGISSTYDTLNFRAKTKLQYSSQM